MKQNVQVALVVLAVSAGSFVAGRVQANCAKSCDNWVNKELYVGSTGPIIHLATTCYLDNTWAKDRQTGTCSGSQVASIQVCVGAGMYCQAPASGEYSLMSVNSSSCSSSATMTCCAACM